MTHADPNLDRTDRVEEAGRPSIRMNKKIFLLPLFVTRPNQKGNRTKQNVALFRTVLGTRTKQKSGTENSVGLVI